jgi:hypothetical protein
MSVLGLTLIPLRLSSAQTVAQQTTTDGRANASRTTYELKIDFNRRVSMRDGTELSADVYRPKAPGRIPVILNRTPYTKTVRKHFEARTSISCSRLRGHSNGRPRSWRFRREVRTLSKRRTRWLRHYRVVRSARVVNRKVGTLWWFIQRRIQWLTADPTTATS